MRLGDFIITYKKIEFWPLDPRESEINIEDIAHALSLLCRYNGHCKFMYSIAEHSIRVSYILPPELALCGLLHDASEAYLSDIPSPTKIFMPQYKEWENNIQSVVYRKFGLPEVESIKVKEADRILLVTEMRDLLPSGLMPNWEVAKQGIIPLEKRINRTMSPKVSEKIFLNRFEELVDGNVKSNKIRDWWYNL